MLDSHSRRPAFDRWFASLSPLERTVVVDAAMRQRDWLQDTDGAAPADHAVSLIDCLENVWDEAREHGILTATDSHLERIIELTNDIGRGQL